MSVGDRRRQWLELLPALALIVAGNVLLAVMAVVSGDGTTMALALATGAALGLLIGALVQLHRHGGRPT